MVAQYWAFTRTICMNEGYYLYTMADVHSKSTRSYNMSCIKGKDTKPEMLVRKWLHAHGFRYRLHDKRLPGKPDIVLPNTKRRFLYMGVFGMDTMIVNIM